MSRHFTFEINALGDRDVGIPDVYDLVVITIDSGDPGGDAEGKEFVKFVQQALQEWYDSPGVELIEIEDDYEGLLYYKEQDNPFEYDMEEENV